MYYVTELKWLWWYYLLEIQYKIDIDESHASHMYVLSTYIR